MRTTQVNAAVAEARRFLKRAKAVLDAHANPGGAYVGGFYVDASKESGALRRASMDLTRALAEMRRA